MATVQQIVDTFRVYADEPDQTFLSDTVIQRIMNVAYQEFRQKAMEADPSILARTVDITLASASSADLSAIAPPILGTAVPADGTRLVKLLSVYTVDGTSGLPTTMYTGVGNFQALTSTGTSYYMQGAVLWLSGRVTGTVRLLYVGDGTDVSWDPAGASWALPPDDLAPVHDLIALYAYRQYQMMDSAVSQALMIQIQSREKAIEEYLQTRSIGGPDYVQDVTSRDLFS